MRKMLDTLTLQVNVLLGVATPHDEVVVRVCSPGGGVSDYGLAAAQLLRLRAAGVNLTACVDVVAASPRRVVDRVSDTPPSRVAHAYTTSSARVSRRAARAFGARVSRPSPSPSFVPSPSPPPSRAGVAIAIGAPRPT